MNLAGNLEKKNMGQRKAQDSQQEKEREVHQDITGVFWQQTQMLQTLVGLQIQQHWSHFSLQFMVNSIQALLCSPSSPPPPPTFHMAPGTIALPPQGT